MFRNLSNKNTKINWVTILSIVIVFVLVLISLYFLLTQKLSGFDGKTVAPIEGFQYGDILTCTIEYSTHNTGIKSAISLPWLEYSSFSLKGLNNSITELVVDTGINNEYIKKYESNEHVILISKSDNWNTDTISLMKTNGSFVRTITGLQSGDWKFHYAIAQKGNCE